VATVNKVEQGESDFAACETRVLITDPLPLKLWVQPGFGSPFLLNVSPKQTIIAALKRREPGGGKSGWEGDFLFSCLFFAEIRTQSRSL
jgi:hypothetical protein